MSLVRNSYLPSGAYQLASNEPEKVMTSSLVSASTRPRVGRLSLLATAAASVLVVGSLLGFAWTFIPANPTAQTPEMWMTFSDLSAATAQSPSAIQAAYFGWLAWTLVACTVLVAFGAVITGLRPLFGVEVALGLAMLIITMFASKGPSSWGTVIAALPDLRIGALMMLVGSLGFAIQGAAAAWKASRPRVTHAESI